MAHRVVLTTSDLRRRSPKRKSPGSTGALPTLKGSTESARGPRFRAPYRHAHVRALRGLALGDRELHDLPDRAGAGDRDRDHRLRPERPLLEQRDHGRLAGDRLHGLALEGAALALAGHLDLVAGAQRAGDKLRHLRADLRRLEPSRDLRDHAWRGSRAPLRRRGTAGRGRGARVVGVRAGLGAVGNAIPIRVDELRWPIRATVTVGIAASAGRAGAGVSGIIDSVAVEVGR